MKHSELVINGKLSSDEHRLRVVKKHSRSINFIFRFFMTCNAEFLLKSYKCYARPLLDYCCHLYHATTSKNIRFVGSNKEHFTERLLGARSFY